MLSPFQISVFGRTFVRSGVVGNPLSQSWTPRFNAVGTGEFTVAATDPMLEFLYQDGARVRVTYKGEHLMSGPVLHPTGDFGANGVVTFQVEDDYRMMANTLGWVRPNPITQSSGNLSPENLEDPAQAVTDVSMPGLAFGGGHFLFPDGSAAYGGVTLDTAESAVKYLISQNMVLRLARPVTVAPDLLRGGNARTGGMLPFVRFSPLAEAVAELLEWSGLGLTFVHNGSTGTVTADVFTPTVWPQVLTVESGIIQGGEWSRQSPTATRIVVGGPGEDVARAFHGVNNVALEAARGDIVEVFRDATGANLLWPDTLADTFRVAKYFLLRSEVPTNLKTAFLAYLNQAGNKGLFEGRATSGLSLTLSETEAFYFGPGGYSVGDMITARSAGVSFTDRITECTLSESVTAGVTVIPRVGNRTDDPNTIFARAIQRLATAQRRLSTSK